MEKNEILEDSDIDKSRAFIDDILPIGCESYSKVQNHYPNNVILELYRCDNEEQLNEKYGIDLTCHPDLNKPIFDMVVHSLLTDREQLVVHDKCEYYLTYKEIADKLGVTISWPRQIYLKSLRKMRFRRDQIEDIIVSINVNADVCDAMGHYINNNNPKANKIIKDLSELYSLSELDIIKLIISDVFIQTLLNDNVNTTISSVSDIDRNTMESMRKTLKSIVEGDTSLSDNILYLGLSMKACTSLYRAGIVRVDKLLNLSKDDLLKIRNIGESTATHIIQCVEKAGLTLREDS